MAAGTDGYPAVAAVSESALDATIDQLQDQVLGCATRSCLRTASGHAYGVTTVHLPYRSHGSV